ncbi:MAG: glycosyltransferase [Burkholderiales bacterium]|nr:glycosyltransferase [Acidobacteriaceae bacterium]MCA3213356.1 glycosyltransferase [Burkholderiales bacterium]
MYIRTDAEWLRATAASLFAQSVPFDAWIILAHGPIAPETDAALGEIARDPRVTILREPVNLGIMGGMRLCLEQARTEYVVPMDADDLLTPDALQVLSAEIERGHAPALLYSDEDILVGGRAQSPYRRPDWDPVLNLASSYIWHLCCIRRDAALREGLYTDPGATWCHDWDTSFRIARSGETPLHVPEVLYHWRQHPASTSNSAGGVADGSRQSTRHLLERFVAAQPRPELYAIADFPVFRGAPEWYVFREPRLSPPVAVLYLGAEARLPPGIPAASQVRLATAVPPARGRWPWRKARPAPAAAGALAAALEAVREPHVLLLGDGIEPEGEGWWWEAVKLFELHPEIALVGGLLTDRSDRVLRGLEVLDEAGGIHAPQRGARAQDAGPFALWLKPQCVDGAATAFCMVETELLRRSLEELPAETPLHGLGWRLAAQGRAEGRLAAWSPLMRATATAEAAEEPLGQSLPVLRMSGSWPKEGRRLFSQRSRLASYDDPSAERIPATAAAVTSAPNPIVNIPNE